MPAAAAADSTTHSGSKWLKTAQNKSSCCDFMNFYLQGLKDSHNFCLRSLHELLCL